MAWPPIPQDVLDWCRAIVCDANWRLTETLQIPWSLAIDRLTFPHPAIKRGGSYAE
jgi:hypothetical protein